MPSPTPVITRDPDADAWLAYFETKRQEAIGFVDNAFRTVAASLDRGETDGEITVVLYAKDEDQGLDVALFNLLALFGKRFGNVAGPSYSHARGARIDHLGEAIDNGACIKELASA